MKKTDVKPLKEFLSKVQDVREDSWEDPEVRSGLIAQYKVLFKGFEDLPAEIINKSFTEEEIKAVHLLELGLEYKEEWGSIAQKILKTSNPEKSFAVWNKSRAGFEFINRSKEQSEAEKDKSMQALFGSLFGVQIALDCVKSIKAEHIGDLIGYAMSGLAKVHRKEYDAAVREGRKNLKPLGEFLLQKMEESRVVGKYSFVSEEVTPNEERICTTFELFKAGKRSGISGAFQVDTCYWNQDAKKIAVGFCTTNMKDLTKQKNSAARALQALRTATQTPGHLLYNVQVESFYYFSGAFVADDQSPTAEQGHLFLEQWKTEKSNGLTKEQKEVLAQLPFPAILGNMTHPQDIEEWAAMNSFIAGCDTLKWYDQREEWSAGQGTGVQMRKRLLDHVRSTLEILNKSKMDFVGEGFHGSEVMSVILGWTCSIVEALPYMSSIPISDKDYSAWIDPLFEEAKKLELKIEDLPHGSLRTAGFKLSDGIAARLSDIVTWNQSLTTARARGGRPMIFRDGGKNKWEEVIAAIEENRIKAGEKSKSLDNWVKLLCQHAQSGYSSREDMMQDPEVMAEINRKKASLHPYLEKLSERLKLPGTKNKVVLRHLAKTLEESKELLSPKKFKVKR